MNGGDSSCKGKIEDRDISMFFTDSFSMNLNIVTTEIYKVSTTAL